MFVETLDGLCELMWWHGGRVNAAPQAAMEHEAIAVYDCIAYYIAYYVVAYIFMYVTDYLTNCQYKTCHVIYYACVSY